MSAGLSQPVKASAMRIQRTDKPKLVESLALRGEFVLGLRSQRERFHLVFRFVESLLDSEQRTAMSAVRV